MKIIKITYKSADSKSIEDLIPFQEDIKKVSNENLMKLKKSILKYGFSAPIFIWKNKEEHNIIDGHGRLKALLDLKNDGYNIPLIPVDYIEARTKKEAKEKLLRITSQYGEFNISKLDLFSKTLDLKEINIQNFNDFKNDLKVVSLFKETLKPYKKIHVLLSTDIKNIDKMTEIIEKIKDHDWIEYEQSQN